MLFILLPKASSISPKLVHKVLCWHALPVALLLFPHLVSLMVGNPSAQLDKRVKGK